MRDKTRVVIIGAGFAGICALKALCRHRKGLEITVIDKCNAQSFLPLLPDVLGRNIFPDYLTFNVEEVCNKLGVTFLQEAVTAVDLDAKQVSVLGKTVAFDYLLIASGSETNFYANTQIRDASYKVDDAFDAARLRSALENKSYMSFVVSGGGYTGIEVATNIRLFLERHSLKRRVVIVERALSILGPLPQWMKEYVLENLRMMNIELFTNTAIEKVEADKISLQGGLQFDNAILVWAAGVRTADFIQHLKAEKNPQGRLKVDEYLRLNESCFVAGDASLFTDKKNPLRMAVQFAIYEGEQAARNILRSIEGKKLRPYKPFDAGYIIPMANNYACGIIFGVNLKGRFPLFLHYLMCIYRSCGFKNKLGIIKSLFTGGG